MDCLGSQVMTPVARHGLHFFGRPKLITRSGDQLPLRPNLWRILAILAAGPSEGTPRIRLIELTLPGGKAGTLRKALWDLREVERKAAIQMIDADGSSLRLADGIYCDVRDLVSPHSSDLARLYRGQFLELPGDIDYPPWTSWLEDQRARLKSIYVIKASAALAQSISRPTEVRESERLLEVDPHNEAASRAQMLSQAASGNLELAQTVYHNLREGLEQLGRRPEDQTTDLYFRLRSPVGSREFDIGGRRRDPGIPSLCLLKPYGDATQSHGWRLARSLVVDVTIGLCRTSLIRIIAPHTAEQIADPSDLAQSATLMTDYAVSTEVLGHASKANADQVVFTLYSVVSRQILWTERVDIVEHLSVEAYNVLTAGLMTSLVRWIDHTEISSFSLRADPSAYVMFLAGQRSLSSLDLPSIRRGRIMLAKAFRQSPSFAPTVSAMARSFQLEWLLTARGDPDLLEQSELYARSAVEVDPYEARGYRELGFCWLYRKQFDRCLEQYGRAECLSPQHADIIADYADALVHDGQLDAALQKIDRAIELNPLCQDTYHWTKGAAHYFQFNYGEAITSILRMRDQTPALKLLAAAYAQRGDKAEAGWCKTRTMDVYPDMTVAKWTDIVPFRDPRQVKHYVEGLREAGFL